MNDFDEALRKLKALQSDSEQLAQDLRSGTQRFRVNKQTHQIGFEGKTEESVTIVIEKKEGKDIPPPA